MKILFGIVSLVVALAVVALIGKQQMQAVRATSPAPVSSGATPSSGNVGTQSRQMQDQVADDVKKALEAGMQRNDRSDRSRADDRNDRGRSDDGGGR